MYYVTIITEGHVEIPESLAEILNDNRCTVDRHGFPMTVGCPNAEVASGLVSAVTSCELQVGAIEISGRKPVGTPLRAASDN